MFSLQLLINLNVRSHVTLQFLFFIPHFIRLHVIMRHIRFKPSTSVSVFVSFFERLKNTSCNSPKAYGHRWQRLDQLSPSLYASDKASGFWLWVWVETQPHKKSKSRAPCSIVFLRFFKDTGRGPNVKLIIWFDSLVLSASRKSSLIT